MIKHTANQPSNTPNKYFYLFLIISIFLLVTIYSVGNYIFGKPITNLLPLPSNLVSLNSSIGKEILNSSQFQKDFKYINDNYEAQNKRAFCGIASIVIVLNALNDEMGLSQRYTQASIFNENITEVFSPFLIALKGLTLVELAKIVKLHNHEAVINHATSNNSNDFEEDVKRVTQQNNDYIIVNYQRSKLGQQDIGHISPIAAYNEKTKQVLIMDVTNYNYPPVWVDIAQLWSAMNTLDLSSGKNRGYIIVSSR